MENGQEREEVDEVDYEGIAYEAIPKLLLTEHAVVWNELEAKLAERAVTGTKDGINPHHLTAARRRLVADEVIKPSTETTRGGHRVTVYVPVNQRLRREAVKRAAQRKRLLEGRYLGWAEQKATRPNLIGQGGEQVARASLRAATAEGAGYRLFNPRGGDITSLFGQTVAGGSLDDAAELIAEARGGVPQIVTLVVEVKNLRNWLYPSAPELFQLLDKAARLQLAHPSRLILPVLVARRVHYLTFRMAKHLGFVALQFDRQHTQPLLPHYEVTPKAIDEVRHELGYSLLSSEGALPVLTRQFSTTLPKIAVNSAMRWAEMAPHLAGDFASLRRSSHGPVRNRALDSLYRTAAAIAEPDQRGPRWRAVAEPPAF